jgi:hypothetical protein
MGAADTTPACRLRCQRALLGGASPALLGFPAGFVLRDLVMLVRVGAG